MKILYIFFQPVAKVLKDTSEKLLDGTRSGTAEFHEKRIELTLEKLCKTYE